MPKVIDIAYVHYLQITSSIAMFKENGILLEYT